MQGQTRTCVTLQLPASLQFSDAVMWRRTWHPSSQCWTWIWHSSQRSWRYSWNSAELPISPEAVSTGTGVGKAVDGLAGATGATGAVAPAADPYQQGELSDQQKHVGIKTAPVTLHHPSKYKKEYGASLPPFRSYPKCLLWPILTKNYAEKVIVGYAVPGYLSWQYKSTTVPSVFAILWYYHKPSSLKETLTYSKVASQFNLHYLWKGNKKCHIFVLLPKDSIFILMGNPWLY